MLKIVSLAVLVALTIGIGIAISQTASTTNAVRIVAQKLEDDRIEFALEHKGERILPRSRYFPANAPTGRWLRSSAVALQSEVPATDSALLEQVTTITAERDRALLEVEALTATLNTIAKHLLHARTRLGWCHRELLAVENLIPTATQEELTAELARIRTSVCVAPPLPTSNEQSIDEAD